PANSSRRISEPDPVLVSEPDPVLVWLISEPDPVLLISCTREGWLYLATVLDVCSRRVVGWAMASQQTRELAERALEMAIVHRRPAPNVVLHHDRGSQYKSARYRAKVETANMVMSMSRP